MSRLTLTFGRRLMLASLATIAVGIGALLIAGNVLLDQRARSQVSSVLRANVDSQLAALHIDGDRIRVREVANDAALDRRGWVLEGDTAIERPRDAAPEVDRLAMQLGRDGRLREVDGPDDTRLRVEPLHAASGKRIGAIVVVTSTESLETLQHAVFVGSLVVAGLVLLAGGFAIRSAVNGALRPVAQMTEMAQTWGAADLDKRFDLGPPRDELTGLAATLDELLGRIAASRRHEQRFAAEVAHEIQTPIAGLRAQAELALGAAGEGADAERRAALEDVAAQTERLGLSIDTLLAVARHELDPTEGSADLAAIAAGFGDGIEVVLGSAVLPAAEGEPEVVRRALAPLVDNARRHARGRVWMELSATDRLVRVAVCDDGPGVAPELGERVFDPGVRGDPDGRGAGLGLPLARRLARSCGGDVRLEPASGGRFVLELPALGHRAAS